MLLSEDGKVFTLGGGAKDRVGSVEVLSVCVYVCMYVFIYVFKCE